MSANESLPIHFTSKAIPASADGYYSYDQLSFLFPHEPIRYEMNRAKNAIEKMNLEQHPWKGYYLNVWLREFLIPVIEDHHESEEKIFDPSYEVLGVAIPERIKNGHKSLTAAITQLKTTLAELTGILDSGIEDHKEEARSKFDSLKNSYNDFYNLTVDHLADEEAFWPEVIRKHGEEKYREIHTAMHRDAKNQASGKLFIMSVFDAMGYEFDINTPTHQPGETRWCGTKQLEEAIINKIPYFVRSWIFPPYNRQYQYYKRLILAAATATEDTLPLKYDESSCVIC
jgi:hypothetical protein